AGSLADARRLMEEHGDALDLLVTDIVMPEVDGRQLARRLAELQPGLRVLFVSGYPADHATPRGTPDSDANFLQKPYSLHALAAKVREILDPAPVVEVTTRK
ncbi:MAG: response regulator, partial [Caldilineaceae bacterium]|nr:response regulator [Caldilineaceae bacterium]